jgi:hypothetical protein
MGKDGLIMVVIGIAITGTIYYLYKRNSGASAQPTTFLGFTLTPTQTTTLNETLAGAETTNDPFYLSNNFN